MRKVLLVLLVGVLSLTAAACSSGDDDDAGAGADYGAAAAEETAADAGEAESGGGEDAVAVAQESSVPSVGPRVIQTASLVLSVPRNEFEKVVDRARVLATSSGGFVVESSASQSGGERQARQREPRRAHPGAELCARDGAAFGARPCGRARGGGPGRLAGVRRPRGEGAPSRGRGEPAAEPARRDEHGRRGADGAIAAEPGAARPGAGARAAPVPRGPGRLRHDLARRS